RARRCGIGRQRSRGPAGVSLVADRPRLAGAPAVPQSHVGQTAARRKRTDALFPRGGNGVLRSGGMGRGGISRDFRCSGAAAPRAEDVVGVETAGTIRVEKTACGVQTLLGRCLVQNINLRRRFVTQWRPLLSLLAIVAACSPAKPPAAPAANVVTITATDYAFGAPDTIPAGLT